ncbi:hypothetical protein HS088_TW05G00398 [Tripterygium wilfordii]|uniref:NT domain of poly(A) polymerase and terminal uridylyl transferase-containing protein n=1 Tax=Tripterygium wilfordii TaxID=458696 RepID=A0A7J7DMV3_TRIWF|nr:uncharacterized protein LOC119998735 [Tripterygium wilfordii]KAF5747671.1 hypothetical protein HS088_TW05G00398 [Tripterygium wilfordii]
MGDHRDWSPETEGAALAEKPSPSNQTPLGVEYWQKAEQVVERIIARVQPTTDSDERRKAVIDYVQRLLRNCLGCEVFPFGSVPLKTYLPDGDIDLTAFGWFNVDEALATDVCSVLEREDENRAAEFIVKDVQLIRAEVKLVKCLVQNIVVDISFNQMGGICTLCFLEQVDQLIGKAHIFKRSIILIKAWCYYESRILGAHHGLISTYALETLVLYIFHRFHSSLNGPLAVLYKFLDYFSKFDWDNYGISLNGPVRLSSLPDVVVDTPVNGGADRLLSNDFLRDCVEMFSVPTWGTENNSRTFASKHLNIVDPLKEYNNLGRSISKGNSYRIRSAFTYGAKKLGQILSQPEVKITDELSKFFCNTLDRHGNGQRPDVQDPIPMAEHNGLDSTVFSGAESYQEDPMFYESAESSGTTGPFKLNHEQPLLPGMDMTLNGPQSSRRNGPNGTPLSEIRLSGDAKDLATSRLQDLKLADDVLKSSSVPDETVARTHKPHPTPRLYFHSSAKGNGEVNDKKPDLKLPESSVSTDKRVSSGISPEPGEDNGFVAHGDQDEDYLINHLAVSPSGSMKNCSLWSPAACSVEDLHPGYSSYQKLLGTGRSSESSNSLSDLRGDYESILNSWYHARRWLEYAFNAYAPIYPTMPTQLWGKNSREVPRQSVQFGQNSFSPINANVIVPRPGFYPMSPPVFPGTSFGMEEMPKARGTGTYFPNMNHYRERPLTARGRHQAPPWSPRSNIRVATAHDTHFSERSSRELGQVQDHAKSAGRNSGSPDGNSHPRVNGLIHHSERAVEYGPFGYPQWGASSPEGVRLQNPEFSPTQDPRFNIPATGTRKSKQVLGVDQDRIAVQSNQLNNLNLKDEDDFPPLSICPQ